MMNFSDETVTKVGVAVVEKLALISRNVPLEDLCDPLAQAALASLTLADLMQVPEVRELVAGMRAIRDSDNLPQIHACAGAMLTKIRTEAK